MCKSSNEQAEPIDLQKEPYEKITIKINDSEKIEFDIEKWKPSIGLKPSTMSKITEEDNGKDESQEEENQKKIDDMQKEIHEKEDKIEDLKKKIREVDDKIDTMKKILNIDVSEKNYLDDLDKRINGEQNT